MMADEGNLPPPPPRARPRPTIIGRNNNSDNANGSQGPSTSRPAPPPPAAVRPPPVPNRSASLETSDDAPMFQLPPPPKVAAKPAIIGSKPSSSSMRRGKIEITVLDARPMSEVGFRADAPKSAGGDSSLKSPTSPPLLIDFNSDFTTTNPARVSPPEKPVNGGPAPIPPRPTITKTSPISPGSVMSGSLLDIDLETDSKPVTVRRSRSPGPPRPTSQPRGRSPSPKPPRPAPPRPSSPTPKSRGPQRPRSPSPAVRGAPPRPRSPSPRAPVSRPPPPRPSSACPERPSSMIKTPSPDVEDLEVMDNLANEKLLETNEPSKPRPIGPKPTIIRAKPSGPFQQKSPEGDDVPSSQQGRVVRRTVVTTTTTSVKKKDDDFGPCIPPIIGGFGLISLAAGAGALALASTAPPEEKKVSPKTVVTQKTNLPAGIPMSNETSKPPELERKSRPTVIRPPPKPKTSPEEAKPSDDLNDLAEAFENKENETRANEFKAVNRPSSLNPSEIRKKPVVPLQSSASTKKKMPPPPRPVGGPTKPAAPKPKISVTGPPRPKLPGRPKPGHPLYHYMVEGQPHGKALFDYIGEQHDELSFKKDDMIVLVQRLDAEWLMGKLEDKEGMFPQDFVEVIEPLPGEDNQQAKTVAKTEEYEVWDDTPDGKPDTGLGPRCRARFDFEGESADDISFDDGDIIQLVERVGDEWLKGTINGKTGLFPAAFIEIIEDLPPPGQLTANEWPVDVGDGTATGDDNTAKVVYDFNGEEEGELSLKAGDTVHVLNQVSTDWLYGECCGRQGTFPATFVDHIPSNLPPYVPQQSAVQAAAVTSEPDYLQPPEPSSTRDPHCIARYDYLSQTEGDLSFHNGDRIAITGTMGDDWLRGTLHGRDGIFPKDFVEVVVDLPVTEPLPTPSSETHSPEMPSDDDLPRAQALYEFQGGEEELSFMAGDMIVLLDKIDDDWMVGECHDNVGRFPTAFVEILTPLP